MCFSQFYANKNFFGNIMATMLQLFKKMTLSLNTVDFYVLVFKKEKKCEKWNTFYLFKYKNDDFIKLTLLYKQQYLRKHNKRNSMI